MVIWAGGSFSACMSYDRPLRRELGGDSGKYARGLRIIDRSVKPVVPGSCFERAVARDLHRSQVGIFLADSYDLLFVSAVGENLADQLRDWGLPSF
jgi:hypothetical protein